MKKILLVIVCILLLFSFLVNQTKAEQQTASIDVCHKLVNTGKFFAYNFFYACENDQGLRPVESEQCWQLTKTETCNLYAIKKNNVAKLEKELMLSNDFSLNNILNSKYLIKADNDFFAQVDKPKSQSLLKIENHYVIKSITEQLDVAKYKEIRHYQDGRQEIELFDINKVEMSFSEFLKYFSKYWAWYILLLLIIIIIILIRKNFLHFKKRKQ